jgi:hypothetical protein
MSFFMRTRGGGFGGTERFPLALFRGFPSEQRREEVNA